MKELAFFRDPWVRQPIYDTQGYSAELGRGVDFISKEAE